MDAAAPAGDGDGLDPREAAEVLEQTRREARRKFEPNPPLLSLVRAVVILGAYGAVWLSVRAQHPYKGPNGLAIAAVYIIVFMVIGASVAAIKRATAGVGGQSRRQMRASISVLLVAWIVVYVFQGALYHAGVSHAIVYGLYPATVPLMIVGLVGAGIAAAQEDWPAFGSTLTVAVVAAGSSFAGPVNAWLIMGVGLCAAMLGSAAAIAWRQRA